MQSRAVEAARHGEFDVLFEVCVDWSRINATRIEALIKHEALEHRLAVQSELHAVECNASETEIALYRVIAESQDEVIQSALSELPEVPFGELYSRGEAADAVNLDRSGRSAFKEGSDRELSLSDSLAYDSEGSGIHVGEVFRVFYVFLREELQPDCLPDSGCSRVVASGGGELTGLLAARLSTASRIIKSPDENGIVAFPDKLRDIKREGRKAAEVCPCEFAIYVDIRPIIDGTEVQEYPAVKVHLRYLKVPTVADGVHEVLVFDSGEPAFGAERNEYLEWELFLTLIKSAITRGATVIEAELPCSVEVLPRGAFPYRLRMLGAGYLIVNLVNYHNSSFHKI